MRQLTYDFMSSFSEIRFWSEHVSIQNNLFHKKEIKNNMKQAHRLVRVLTFYMTLNVSQRYKGVK